jgi:alpha-beta hydrolase superfamily lysophospholipase/molybdopterin converting factor small subunit
MGLFSKLLKSEKKKISVNVRLACIINTKPVNEHFTLEISDNSNLKNLLRVVESRINDNISPSFTILINGERITLPDDYKRVINDGDNISILSPIAGGKVNRKEGTFTSFDGTHLFFREWNIDNADAVILVIHGLGEHSGRYSMLAGDFNRAGFSVFSFDLRGHGKSEGKRGHIMSFNEYLFDVDNFKQMLLKRFSRPLFILGHSMGGLIAMNFTIKNPANISGLITFGPLLRIRARVPEWKKRLGIFLSNRIPSLGMSNGLNPNHLSHDKEVVRAYRNDPLVHTKVTARWFTEITSAMDETFQIALRLNTPVLMLHGSDDMLTDPEGSSSIFELITFSDKTLKFYDGFYHEIYNEIGREKPVNDTIEWIRKKLPIR